MLLFVWFQSPIGWGLSCESRNLPSIHHCRIVSIPYWLGSKLRVIRPKGGEYDSRRFQSPIGWGLSCEPKGGEYDSRSRNGFNPLLVGV